MRTGIAFSANPCPGGNPEGRHDPGKPLKHHEIRKQAVGPHVEVSLVLAKELFASRRGRVRRNRFMSYDWHVLPFVKFSTGGDSCPGACAGNSRVNTAPWPGPSLCTVNVPFISWAAKAMKGTLTV